MTRRLVELIGVVAVLVAVIVLLRFAPVAGQAPADEPQAVPATPTAWGEPDLQGLWTTRYDTPLQRPARFADQEFFTDEERTDIDRQRSEILGRDSRPAEGTPLGLGGAYNRAVFLTPQGNRATYVADRGSTRWEGSVPHVRCADTAAGCPGVSGRPAEGNRCLQEQPARVCGWGVWGGVSAACRPAAILPGDIDWWRWRVQSCRWTRGSGSGRTLHERSVARLWWGCRVCAADHPVAPVGIDFLRHRSGAGVAADHPGDRSSAPAVAPPTVVGRLAGSMGGRYPRGRRHQLQ